MTMSRSAVIYSYFMFVVVHLMIVLRDLSFAYHDDYSSVVDDDALQYLDYSIYERQLDMRSSSEL